jgi:NAD(P)-dependent dehydrogenase (short-subunit alcohol dehydrogenase family)
MNILITGCSRGIGRGLVESFLQSKKAKKIFAVTQNVESLKPLIAQYPKQLTAIHTSVSDNSSKEAIEKALKNETLDLLINNAGIFVREPDGFSEIFIGNLQKSFEVNTFAAFRTTQACLPALQRSSLPKVVHITSLMGSIADNTSGGSYGYRMSKAALNMFNKSFAVDHPNLISVVVHPGWVKTEMGGQQAPVTLEQSVSGIMTQIEKLNKSDSGKFLDFEGEELPW